LIGRNRSHQWRSRWLRRRSAASHIRATARRNVRRATKFPGIATLLQHLEGILNYCRTRVPFGVVEAINGNIGMPINRGRGYANMRYLLLKAQRMAVTNTEYVALQRTRKAA